MSKVSLESLVNELVCVGINRKVYTAEEVGEDNAGCTSLFLQFEHPTFEGLIDMHIEIAEDAISNFNCMMWDGRTLEEHVGEL